MNTFNMYTKTSVTAQNKATAQFNIYNLIEQYAMKAPFLPNCRKSFFLQLFLIDNRKTLRDKSLISISSMQTDEEVFIL